MTLIHLRLKVQFGNVFKDCEVQLIVPNEIGDVTFRLVYSSNEIEQLRKGCY